LSFVVKPVIAAAAASLVVAAPAYASVPSVGARAYFIVDATTGDVLAQKNADRQLPIASITKLMTVHVALQSRLALDDPVVVRRAVAAVGESSIDLRPGQRISAGDLLKGALIQSANDAADALADRYGPGETAFVARMNAEARRLHLTHTHFARPDGLDAPGHVSTARDVTRLAQVAMRSSIVRMLVRRRAATIATGRTLHTWNDLLGEFRGLDGVKTGHTGGAGWCEVAEVKRDGLDLYATVLGSPSRGQRNSDLAALLRWATAIERPAWVVAPGRVYVRVPAGYGHPAVPLVAQRAVARPIRTDAALTERITAPAAVSLPVHRGDRLGEVRIYSGRRLLARQPLVAARAVARPGLAGRVGFYTGRTFSHIGSWFT